MKKKKRRRRRRRRRRRNQEHAPLCGGGVAKDFSHGAVYVGYVMEH